MSIAASNTNATPAVTPAQPQPVQEMQLPEVEQDKKLLHHIQAKLTVGAPDDPLEHEADAMADRVMRIPETTFIQKKTAASGEEEIQREVEDEEETMISGTDTFLQKKCAACDEEEKVQRAVEDEEEQTAAGADSFLQMKCASCEEEEKVQRVTEDEEEIQRKEDDELEEAAAPGDSFLQMKCAACDEEEKVQRVAEDEEEEIQRKPSFIQKKEDGSSVASSEITSQINNIRGSGSSMEAPVQSFMENRFGADFSGVNIHTDSNAANLSSNLGAKAFTVGSDIYFNEGQYNPGSESGKHLLAHELTHTVQQGASAMVQQKPAEQTGISIQRATPDDDKTLSTVKDDKIFLKNWEHWETYGFAAVKPLRDITPERTPYAYSNRTYRAQQIIRKANIGINNKRIGVDGIFGPEMFNFLYHITRVKEYEPIKFQIAGLGFDMEAMGSSKAYGIALKSRVNLFKLNFQQEWNVSGPADMILAHSTDKNEEESKKWCDQILFEKGAPPQKLIDEGFTLGQRYAILKKIYAGQSFNGRAAFVTANRKFIDNSADNATMVERDPGKPYNNPLRIVYHAQRNDMAVNLETWFGLKYPAGKKAQGLRKQVGLADIDGIPQITGVLLSFYMPVINTAERARIDMIREQYIQDQAQDIDEYTSAKAAAIIAILDDEETNSLLLPDRLRDQLLNFTLLPPNVFEKLLQKLETHANKNYLNLMLDKAKQWRHIPTLQKLVQLCNRTKYKDNQQVKEAFEFLSQLKNYVQSHDYVAGTKDQQGVYLNKNRDYFLRVGDITMGMYRISQTKERLKEEKRILLVNRMKELVEQRISNGLSDNPVPQKDMDEKQLMESVLEQAAQDVKVTDDDIEEVLYEKAYRLKGVQSQVVNGVEDFFVDYEQVERTGGEGNEWQVSRPSTGYETRYEFEEALGWFKFSNTMKAAQKFITYVAAGELVVLGGIFLLGGGGSALIALGGGAKMIGISIGISVFIYWLTHKETTPEGYLKAVLEGYLMAVGLKLLSPVGAGAAKWIGTATFRSKLFGLVAQALIVGGGSGALTGAGGMLIEDIIRGKLRSPAAYLKGAAFGFVVGAMFDLGGSLIIGPLFRTAGRNVLERITNIEQLKAFFSAKNLIVNPNKWGPEIVNAYSGFMSWMKENVEGKLISELARDAREKAKSMLASFGDAVDMTIHRQALDLIEAGLDKESVKALEMLISSSRKNLGKTASRELVDDVLNQLVKEPGRANPFFSVLRATDTALLEALQQGKKLNELANSPSTLSIATARTPAEVTALMKNHFELDIPQLETWSAGVLKHPENVQKTMLDLLQTRGSSVTPKSLLRIADSGTVFSDEVVEGITRMIIEARPKGITNVNIEKMLADVADNKIKEFLEAMGKLPKEQFDDLLLLAGQPARAARLLNYVQDAAQLVRMYNLARKNADALDNIFQLTADKGNFASDIEALLGNRGATTDSVERLVTQFHGDAGLARQAFDNLSGRIEARTLDKMFQNMSVNGVHGEKLAQVLGSNRFGAVDGYIDLIKKASTDLQSLKAVNQALEKAEVLSQRGVRKDQLRFEDDKGTGFHDVDLGIKDPVTPGAYKEAYQFKTLDGALTPKKIQEAAKQLKTVSSPEKILELKCDASTTAAQIETPEMISEMRFQAGLKVPGKGNGITEFHFILSDGTVVIKNLSNL